MEKTPISMVPTGQILTRLVHPSVFALAEISLPLADPETAEKDGVTSYAYGGKAGRILVRNDGIRVLVEAWHKGEKILMCAIRDRKLDGTEGTSPLTFYPNVDPACNRLPASDFKACEISIYSWNPETFLDGLATGGTLGNFIADPDYYVWKNFQPADFFPLWEQAFHIGRGPWQSARPMKGVPQFFVKETIKLLRELGYHRVDAVPSWYNVARFFERLNFRFTYGEHELAYNALSQGLAEFASANGGSPLTVLQETWLVVLQNIPESHIPDELKLAARWPVTHTNSYWVRMHLDLNPYATAKSAAATAAVDEGRLMKGIRALRAQACSDSMQVKVSSRRRCSSCQSALGASSPGATSPAATSSTPVPSTDLGAGSAPTADDASKS
jgi:hypothetical protein